MVADRLLDHQHRRRICPRCWRTGSAIKRSSPPAAPALLSSKCDHPWPAALAEVRRPRCAAPCRRARALVRFGRLRPRRLWPAARSTPPPEPLRLWQSDPAARPPCRRRPFWAPTARHAPFGGRRHSQGAPRRCGGSARPCVAAASAAAARAALRSAPPAHTSALRSDTRLPRCLRDRTATEAHATLRLQGLGFSGSAARRMTLRTHTAIATGCVFAPHPSSRARHVAAAAPPVLQGGRSERRTVCFPFSPSLNVCSA